MLIDGVYGLRFESGAGGDRGEGIAVARSGRILGSDPYGGVFTGRYHYDAACGETLVTVHMVVPPHGVLLTGFEAGAHGVVLEMSGRFRRPAPVSSAVIDVAGAPVAIELRYVGALID